MRTLKDKLVDRFSELMKVYKLQNGSFVVYEMQQEQLPNADGVARIHHLIPDFPELINSRLMHAMVTYQNKEPGKDIATRLNRILLQRYRVGCFY